MNFFWRLFFGLFFLEISALSQNLRVQKLGENGRAIVLVDGDPILIEGNVLKLKAIDKELENFTEELSVKLLKVRGDRALVKFPSARSLYVGEKFKIKQITSPPSSETASDAYKKTTEEADDLDPPSPHLYGFELGGANERDLGGLEAGQNDYDPLYSKKNWIVGFLYRYDLPQSAWDFQSGLFYTKRTYKYSLVTEAYDSKVYYEMRSLEIPAVALYQIPLGSHLSFTPGVGLNMRYGAGRVKIDSTLTTSTSTASQSSDKSYKDLNISKLAFELALQGGFEMSFEKMIAFSNFKIHWGLNDRGTDSNEKTKKALSFNLTLGMLF